MNVILKEDVKRGSINSRETRWCIADVEPQKYERKIKMEVVPL